MRYVPEAVAVHSHNYTAEEARRRSFGDAQAMGRAWPEYRAPGWSWGRTVLMGWLKDLAHDLRYAWRTQRLFELPHAMHIRWVQRSGKLEGFRQGYAETHA